jgi:hypothetical protein
VYASVCAYVCGHVKVSEIERERGRDVTLCLCPCPFPLSLLAIYLYASLSHSCAVGTVLYAYQSSVVPGHMYIEKLRGRKCMGGGLVVLSW